MGLLEKKAVLARSRGAEKPNLGRGEKPAWWTTAEEKKERLKNILSLSKIKNKED